VKICTTRRNLLALCSAAAISTSVGLAAHAQTAYPNKPITLVVPFASGGPTDASARVVAKVIGSALGQNVVVDNKPGGGGVVGTTAVSKATPDGYTLLWGGTSSLAVSPGLQANVGFDPVKSFVPIGMATLGPMALVTRSDLNVKSAKDLVDYAKKSKLNMGSGGNGTLAHLAGEYFQEVTGVKFTHIPYRGGSPALNDLLGKQIDLVFDNVSFLMPHIQAGNIKVHAVTSRQRLPDLPEVPTVKELFGGDYEVYSWFGLVAPAGTPPEVVRKLEDAMAMVSKDPEAVRSLKAAGLQQVASTAESFGKTIAQDSQKWAGIIRRAKVTID
jgi:tripartite-type tricarboxylate transporter receptor subunit TctC